MVLCLAWVGCAGSYDRLSWVSATAATVRTCCNYTSWPNGSHSGGSADMGLCCVLQAALLLCGSMTGALPVAAAAYMAVCFVWLNSTLSLARDMSGQAESEMVSHRTVVSKK